MKKLVKLFVFSILALISVQTFAQKIGVQGGINLATMLAKDDESTYSDEFDMNLGFNAGITFEIGFNDLLSLEAGVMADSKGFDWDTDFLGIPVKTEFNLLYLDVPVLIKVGPSFGPVKVFGAAGPYVGFGISGKIKAEAQGTSTTEDVNWGDSEDSDLKSLDYGAKFGAGVEVKGFTLGAYYSLGLANVEPVSEGGSKSQHRVLSFSVGYKIGI